MYNIDLKKEFANEQKRLAACKTKEDLNNLFKDRKIRVQNTGTDWDGELCSFVEMVGEGKRENWKMQVMTDFGTTLDLKPNECFIITHQIKTNDVEAEKIRKHLESKYGGEAIYKNPKP